MRLPRPNSRLGWVATIAAATVLAAALFVWVAPYNVAARIPHLPGVSWLLHTYMRSSVGTWSLTVAQPDWVDLEDPALVRLGAAHFETGCAPCHGTPGRTPNPLTRGMRPAPPPLQDPVTHYDAHELYWIVRNGLKYTGMPAWSGAHRDDEPWALAAFLLRYPELDPAAYLGLAYGPAAPSSEVTAARSVEFGGPAASLETLVADCARCHGEDGLGRDGTAPKLAGQSEAYMVATLEAYAEQRRPSGIMGPIAATLSADEIGRLASYYADLDPFEASADMSADAAAIELGAELAAHGAEVPSCLSCHDQARTPPPKPIYPRISGQTERFLRIWLHLWRERTFGGTDYANVMHEAATLLTDEQIDALAAFFAAGANDAPDAP